MKIFRKKSNQFVSQVVILAMVFGFAAGVVGQLVADTYLDPYAEYADSYIAANTNIAPIIPELSRLKRFLGIEQDFAVDKAVQKTQLSLAGIYLEKTANNTISQAYLPSDLLANAFVLTSDGWLVTDSKIFSRYQVNQLAVAYQNKIYQIEKDITDDVSGITFVKISASNLPVMVLGDSDEMIRGQLAVVLNALGQVEVLNLKSNTYYDLTSPQDLIQSSEEYHNLFLFNTHLDQSFVGSPVVNLAGEVVGVINYVDLNDNLITAVPLNQFRPVALDVLRSNVVKRPYLGVEYLDLSQTIGLSDSVSQGLDRGALVFQQPTKSSPAAEAGVKLNDIILSVEGQLVGKDSSLTELIQQYQPADQIILEVLRDGQVISFDVTLSLLTQ
ncbi:MAG: S1C family serine protease [Patescibacteria group bacterium]|jgi:S1-C subfamily serine protease|nr:S1C family serine protease [Patescibacteria group bacterium]